MKMLETIRNGVEKYNKRNLEYPLDVHMSAQTLDVIKIESAKYLNVWVMGGIEKIYGMKINKDNRLPFGVAIVGGVVCDFTEDERAVDG